MLVSRSTKDLLGDGARVREIEGLALKGVAEPVTGYVVEYLPEERLES